MSTRELEINVTMLSSFQNMMNDDDYTHKNKSPLNMITHQILLHTEAMTYNTIQISDQTRASDKRNMDERMLRTLI